MSCSLINNADKYYVGIDLHKKYSYITITDMLGYIQYQGKYLNRDRSLVPALLKWQQRKPISTVLESTYGWYWLAEEMEDKGVAFQLAHPAKVNAIAGKKKTDAVDAKILADLLRTNMLPIAYVPSKEERSIKELLRFRLTLVRSLATVKRRLRDILAKQNINCDYHNILGKKATLWLRSLDCPYPYQDEIKLFLQQAITLKQQIKEVEALVLKHCEQNDQVKLLETIPGIGSVLGLTLVTEIGDFHRFQNDRALASYAGVVPSVKSSGGKTYLGRTSHGNPYIRWALSEAVTHLKTHDSGVAELYDRVYQKKGSKGKARMATMNKLIRIIYAMLTKNRPYQSPDKTVTSPANF